MVDGPPLFQSTAAQRIFQSGFSFRKGLSVFLSSFIRAKCKLRKRLKLGFSPTTRLLWIASHYLYLRRSTPIVRQKKCITANVNQFDLPYLVCPPFCAVIRNCYLVRTGESYDSNGGIYKHFITLQLNIQKILFKWKLKETNRTFISMACTGTWYAGTEKGLNMCTVRLRWLRWDDTDRRRDTVNDYRILVGKPPGKRPIGRQRTSRGDG
jgi:hypothetical protein